MIAYVDVDDTLLRTSGSTKIPMPHVVEHIRTLHEDGVELYCWSAGGGDYARECARFLGIEELFTAFLPKPRVIIDDQDVSEWPFCVTVHPNWCAGKGWQHYLDPTL